MLPDYVWVNLNGFLLFILLVNLKPISHLLLTILPWSLLLSQLSNMLHLLLRECLIESWIVACRQLGDSIGILQLMLALLSIHWWAASKCLVAHKFILITFSLRGVRLPNCIGHLILLVVWMVQVLITILFQGAWSECKIS